MKKKIAKQTILEEFQAYTDQRKTNDEIIQFLSILNARMLVTLAQYNEDIPDALKEEIIEFTEYFYDLYGEVTQEERLQQWGMEPLILRMGDTFQEEKYWKKKEEVYKVLPDALKREVISLTKTLCKEKAVKVITASYDGVSEDGGATDVCEQMTSPKINKKNQKEIYDKTLLFAASCIDTRAGIFVRMIDEPGKKNGKQRAFGIKVNPFGVWEPLSADKCMKAHNTSADGLMLEQLPNVEYIEVRRPR